MPVVLLLVAAVLFLAGVAAAAGSSGAPALLPRAGAVLVVVSGLALAWFVFSGDPYVQAAALWREGRRRSPGMRTAALLSAAACVVLQAIAAVSQDLN